MIRFKARKSVRVRPFRFTVNQAGRLTWGIKVWRLSWSAATWRWTFDTPGPGRVEWGGRRRRSGGAR